jgi:hypothetical protein
MWQKFETKMITKTDAEKTVQQTLVDVASAAVFEARKLGILLPPPPRSVDLSLSSQVLSSVPRQVYEFVPTKGQRTHLQMMQEFYKLCDPYCLTDHVFLRTSSAKRIGIVDKNHAIERRPATFGDGVYAYSLSALGGNLGGVDKVLDVLQSLDKQRLGREISPESRMLFTLKVPEQSNTQFRETEVIFRPDDGVLPINMMAFQINNYWTVVNPKFFDYLVNSLAVALTASYASTFMPNLFLNDCLRQGILEIDYSRTPTAAYPVEFGNFAANLGALDGVGYIKLYPERKKRLVENADELFRAIENGRESVPKLVQHYSPRTSSGIDTTKHYRALTNEMKASGGMSDVPKFPRN